MQWEFIVALAIAIPIILIPALFVWYLLTVGFYARTKEAQERRAAVRRLVGEAIQIIRNKQALNRSILEAIENAEKEQIDLRKGRSRWVGEEGAPPEPTMPTLELEEIVKADSTVAIAEEVKEEELAQVEEVIDEATGNTYLPPCQIACPIGEPIQRTNTMIALLPLDADEAYNQIIKIGDEIYEKNPLFPVCSYICGLCEKECNYKDQTGAIRREMLLNQDCCSEMSCTRGVIDVNGHMH